MEKKILYIGRAPDNDVVIEDESVSKKHIQLSYDQGTCYVRDVGSSNGTFINEIRIPLYELMPLQAEDVLKLATVVFPWQMYFEAITTENESSVPESEPQPSPSDEMPSTKESLEEEIPSISSPKNSLKESIIKHKKKVNRVQDIAFYALLGLTLAALAVWYFTSVTKP